MGLSYGVKPNHQTSGGYNPSNPRSLKIVGDPSYVTNVTPLNDLKVSFVSAVIHKAIFLCYESGLLVKILQKKSLLKLNLLIRSNFSSSFHYEEPNSTCIEVVNVKFIPMLNLIHVFQLLDYEI